MIFIVTSNNFMFKERKMKARKYVVSRYNQYLVPNLNSIHFIKPKVQDLLLYHGFSLTLICCNYVNRVILNIILYHQSECQIVRLYNNEYNIWTSCM